MTTTVMDSAEPFRSWAPCGTVPRIPQTGLRGSHRGGHLGDEGLAWGRPPVTPSSAAGSAAQSSQLLAPIPRGETSMGLLHPE